ncbi:hypothetical protein M0R45_021106 [Rubus argutus]|uniref:glucan endo-1,3-beta-D-glucosidase n=1 Tax=Rubus argutus TaxID=59490 RepID=A0AAW1XBJ8_RUBAR
MTPNQAALEALRGSNIELMLGCPKLHSSRPSQQPFQCTNWVKTNVLNFYPSVRIKYIAVGNEVSPVNGDTSLAKFLLPAMQNVYQAIRSAGLHDRIKVSTAIDMTLIGVSYPPSQGAFRGDVRGYLDPIIGYMVYCSSTTTC